jgi:hypothetical protein
VVPLTRYAYKRLLEGVAEKEIEKTIQEKHKLNARYVKEKMSTFGIHRLRWLMVRT